jgi:chromate transporter
VHPTYSMRIKPALARDALTDPVTIVIAVATLVLMLVPEIDTLWIILGAAVISLSALSLGLIH